MLAVNLAIVAKYSPCTVPVSDEFNLLGDGGGFTLAWLWEQHAEHRIPLAKLLWIGVLRLTDYDFRIGNLLEVAALGVMALALIGAARRLRGETRLSDAFFPLALLNFGQTQPVFLWWWQVNHTLAPFLACALLLIVVKPPPLRLRNALLAGIFLILPALSGPGGLPYVPALGLWLGGRGFQDYSSSASHETRNGLMILGLVAAAVLLVALYFVGYDKGLAATPP